MHFKSIVMFCVGGKDGNDHLDNQDSSENSFEETSGNSIGKDDSNDDHILTLSCRHHDGSCWS